MTELHNTRTAMAETMYSADEAAQILGLQVRTVRNYVREGRLAGVRIGKQYRIARVDLEAFTAGGTTREAPLGLDTAPQPPQTARAPEVSSVVEIDAIDPASSERLRRTLAAAVVAEQRDGVGTRVEPIYDEERARLRLIIVGSVRDTAELLRIVDALTADR